jgi:hypothetical protein
MSGTSLEAVWNSICTRVHDAVETANRQCELNLRFRRFEGGFSVSRQTPFLMVEERFSLGEIYGTTEHWDGNFVAIRGQMETLRILDQNRLSTTDGQSATVEGFIQGILNRFRDSTGRCVA